MHYFHILGCPLYLDHDSQQKGCHIKLNVAHLHCMSMMIIALWYSQKL